MTPKEAAGKIIESILGEIPEIRRRDAARMSESIMEVLTDYFYDIDRNTMREIIDIQEELSDIANSNT